MKEKQIKLIIVWVCGCMDPGSWHGGHSKNRVLGFVVVGTSERM